MTTVRASQLLKGLSIRTAAKCTKEGGQLIPISTDTSTKPGKERVRKHPMATEHPPSTNSEHIQLSKRAPTDDQIKELTEERKRRLKRKHVSRKRGR
jgi:hypothetical protein